MGLGPEVSDAELHDLRATLERIRQDRAETQLAKCYRPCTPYDVTTVASA